MNRHSGAIQADKRASFRKHFDIQVGVATQHRLFVGLSSNISSGGLFIATEEDLSPGDRLDVRFSIPGSTHVFVKAAEVCWIRPIDDANGHNGGEEGALRSGAGVRLLDLTEEERRILDGFLKAHDPIFYER
jgi:uncharacterized protein (TIGR02266 family)